MNPALLLALLEIVGPPMAKLIAAGIEALTESIRAANAPVTTAGVVEEIVLGIERDHAELAGPEKFELAYAAVAQFLANHGAEADPKVINGLIELAAGGMGHA